MTINKLPNGKIIPGLIVGSFALAYACYLCLPGLFAVWNDKAVDQLFLLRSVSDDYQPTYDDTIVHVDLNNSSIRKLGKFYLNRGLYAQLTDNLTAMQVRLQLYDFIFAAPADPEGDMALIQAVERADNAYFGLAFELTEPDQTIADPHAESESDGHVAISAMTWQPALMGNGSDLYVANRPLPTFDALASVSQGLGFLNLMADRDGVFRRVPLLVRLESGFFPSLAFLAVCRYLNVPPDRIAIDPGNAITLKGAMPADSTAPIDIRIPIDRQGRMIVNFIGPWGRMKHYSFIDILNASGDRDEMQLWREELSGKMVLVAETTTGSSDIGPVPVDTNYPLSGVHANAIHTILSRSFLRELSWGAMLLVECSLMSLLYVAARRRSAILYFAASFVLVGGYLLATALCFIASGTLLNIVRPLLMVWFALVAVTFFRYLHEEKEKAIVKRTFEAYFPPEVVQKAINHPNLIAHGGSKKELTILFSDIKGFTQRTQEMAPERIREMLNGYFEAMTEVVFKHHVTLDKFIGDGLMVFFGDPRNDENHALSAVQAAIEMQQEVCHLNRRRKNGGEDAIQIRIGINTGIVVVGNMGSSKRLSYTVLGSAVNLAQRLESSAPVDGILIAQRTRDLIAGQIAVRATGPIRVKGFNRDIDVYEVLA